MGAAIGLVGAVFLTSACVEPELRPTPEVGRDYRIDVSENRASRQFDLRFISLSNRRLCLEFDTWPFEGRLSEVWQTTVFLQSGDNRFPMHGPVARPADTFRIFVEPRERVDGSIPFSAFDTGAFSESASRTLEYRAGVTFCDELPQ